MKKPYLIMNNINKTYPGVVALDHVSLTIHEGEIHALVGENGAGKSTLIKILAGVIRPDPGGEFEIDGDAMDFHNAAEANKQGISVNYQDLSLFPNLTVAENITIGQTSTHSFRVNWKEMRRKAKEALDRLGLSMELDIPLEKLSIAKQQLVSIARAIAFEAKLIVLDEPTSSLSSGEVEVLFRIIRELRERGISILFVSHKLDELFAVADRFTVLRDGQFVGCYDRDDLDEKKLIRLMVGRNVEYERQVEEPLATAQTVLEVRNLTKKGHYKNINFLINAGEIVCITGLVGAGRTELAQTLFGILSPDTGDIVLNGSKIHVKSTADAVRQGIAYIPESRQTQGLILSQSVTRNITLAVLKQLTNPYRLIQKRQEQDMADIYLSKLDIRPRLPRMVVNQLSGGNQQKVVIAKWLATKPQLLIIDEPTNGIDIGAKAEIHRLLRELSSAGMAILMISSELPEVLASCHRILVMRRGRLVGEFNGNDATQVDIMNKALLGTPLKVPSRGGEAS